MLTTIITRPMILTKSVAELIAVIDAGFSRKGLKCSAMRTTKSPDQMLFSVTNLGSRPKRRLGFSLYPSRNEYRTVAVVCNESLLHLNITTDAFWGHFHTHYQLLDYLRGELSHAGTKSFHETDAKTGVGSGDLVSQFSHDSGRAIPARR